MNEPSNAPMFDAAPPEPFYQVWIKAVSKPNELTYAEIANSPNASPNTAYVWVFLTSLISYFLVLTATMLGTASEMSGDITTLAITLACGAPILAGVSVLGFAINIAITQWVAGLFKGTGNYNQLAYAAGAVYAPIGIVSGVISALSTIPYIGLCFSALSFGVSIYSIVLMVMAVKGVNRFGWGEAVGSVLIPTLVIGFICACVVIGMLMLLGPVVGDVFSTIDPSLMP